VVVVHRDTKMGHIPGASQNMRKHQGMDLNPFTVVMIFVNTMLEGLEFDALVLSRFGAASEAMEPVEMSRIHGVFHRLEPIAIEHRMKLDAPHPIFADKNVVSRK